MLVRDFVLTDFGPRRAALLSALCSKCVAAAFRSSRLPTKAVIAAPIITARHQPVSCNRGTSDRDFEIRGRELVSRDEHATFLIDEGPPG